MRKKEIKIFNKNFEENKNLSELQFSLIINDNKNEIIKKIYKMNFYEVDIIEEECLVFISLKSNRFISYINTQVNDVILEHTLIIFEKGNLINRIEIPFSNIFGIDRMF